MKGGIIILIEKCVTALVSCTMKLATFRLEYEDNYKYEF